MLKTGIYNLKQLRNKNLDNIWNKRKNIALNLYFNLYKQEFQDFVLVQLILDNKPLFIK